MMGMTLNQRDEAMTEICKWENITKDEGHDDGDACEQDDDFAC